MEEENVIFYYFNEKGQKLYTPKDLKPIGDERYSVFKSHKFFEILSI
jgi:hypothetical protein